MMAGPRFLCFQLERRASAGPEAMALTARQAEARRSNFAEVGA